MTLLDQFSALKSGRAMVKWWQELGDAKERFYEIMSGPKPDGFDDVTWSRVKALKRRIDADPTGAKVR